jgi:hypothetical protein
MTTAWALLTAVLVGRWLAVWISDEHLRLGALLGLEMVALVGVILGALAL